MIFLRQPDEPALLDKATEDVQDSFGRVAEKLDGWLDAFVALLPNIAVALLVVAVFALLARLVSKLCRRFLSKVTGSKSIAQLLSTLAGIGVLFAGIFIALSVLQLDKTVTSLLAGAGVVGIALAFAFQDLAANLIAGVFLSFQRPFVIGDLIETNGIFGMVERIYLRNSLLRTNDGQLVMIPNKEIFENTLVNFSKSRLRRVDLQVGVSYAEDLDKVYEVTQEAIGRLDCKVESKPQEVYYLGFGDSSIDLVARFWIDFHRQVEYRRAVSEAVRAIKRAYDAHDITIPFPIRTLDFGIKGGVPLSDEMGPERLEPPDRATAPESVRESASASQSH